MRRLADVLGGPLGEPVSARVLLEQALANDPADAALLDELGSLLEREGAAGEWEPFVRRAAAEGRTPERRLAALVRLRDSSAGAATRRRWPRCWEGLRPRPGHSGCPPCSSCPSWPR